jgi:hypothetical protein
VKFRNGTRIKINDWWLRYAVFAAVTLFLPARHRLDAPRRSKGCRETEIFTVASEPAIGGIELEVSEWHRHVGNR